MPKILYVEDDEVIRKSYSGLLKRAGFDIVATEDITSALQSYDSSPPDLALLDITLGDDTEAGFSLCAELRKRSETLPIIFLSALDTDIDKISGLRLGADDYITKDINIDYLIVRIKTLLKRIQVLSKKSNETPNRLERGELILDMDTLTASWKGRQVDLSLTHLWMVYALVNHLGHVRTPEQLMEAANTRILPNTLTAHITNIRKKFILIDPDFSAIKTERAIGYRWVAADD